MKYHTGPSSAEMAGVAMVMVGASFLFSKLKVIVPVSDSPVSSVTVIFIVRSLVSLRVSKSKSAFSETTPAEDKIQALQH